MTSTIARENSPGITISQAEQVETHSTAVIRDSWLSLTALVALGGISGAAYFLGFVRPYQLKEYYLQPLLDLAKINGHTPGAANDWALTWIALFACYYFAFRMCPPAASISRGFKWASLLIICGFAAFFCINLVFMYPVGAADIFDQIFRARLLSHYHLSPFTTLPLSIQGDIFQSYVAWRGDPSPYGPVWETLAGGTSWLAGDSLWNNLILFKLLVLVAYGFSVALTYGILREVKPDWALRGTLFFAWNPLVVFEIAGNGHNDAIVALFLLAAVYLFVRAWRWPVIPALMAGALTKFVPVLLIPVAAAAIWRDRLPRARGSDNGDNETDVVPARRPLSNIRALTTLAVSGVITLALAVVFYWPFWQGPKTVGALGRQSLFTASIPKVTLDLLQQDLGIAEGTAQTLVRNAAFAIVIAVTVFQSVRIFLRQNARTPEERHALVSLTLSALYEILFIYFAFGTLWFQPWYLIWLVALTAPMAQYVNANRTILFCLGGVANYFVWDFLWLWNRSDSRNIQVASAIVVYTAPLLYSLYTWLRPIWDKTQEAEMRTAPAEAGRYPVTGA